MQLSIWISSNTQSKSYTLLLTECVWEFRNNALRDTHYHGLSSYYIHWVSNLMLMSRIGSFLNFLPAIGIDMTDLISVAHFHFWPFHALVLRISQLLSSFNSNKRVVTIHKAVFLNLGVPFSSHTENINVLWKGTQNIFHLIYLAVECPPSSYGSYSSEHCNRPTVLISKIQLSARWHNYLQ